MPRRITGGKAPGSRRPVAGITALVPPEIIYSAGWSALDINNGIPASDCRPRSKLCAWTAGWREGILSGSIRPDALIVVAGGDCHNALADGQNAARKVKASHFFFYPFDGDKDYLRKQLVELEDFLQKHGGTKGFDYEAAERIGRLKQLGLRLDRLRSDGSIDPQAAFKALISFSDLEGDPARFQKKVAALVKGARDHSATERIGGLPRVALIGVPPIYRDFHKVCAEAGLHVVFDELPYEFVRLGGSTLEELARSYSTYTFARPVQHRLDFLGNELKRRKIDGIVHYTQFTCHHLLEDGLLRERLKWPMLTVQGDLPGETPAQLRLRLEAFGELLGSFE